MKCLPSILALLLTAVSVRADLFVSSFSQHSVRRYDETTGAFLGTFISAGAGGLNEPHRGIFGPDGHYYVASAGNDRILRYHGQTGAFIDVFIQNEVNGLPANALDYPVDLAFGPDGALYISSQANDSVLRFNATTGAFIDVFISAGSGGLDGPSGIQFHGGDLFVVGRYSQGAYRFDGVTGAFELTIGTGVLSTSFGLDFDAGGNLYVASGGNSTIYRFDPVSGASLGAFVASGSGGLGLPIGIEFGPDGQLYTASFNSNSIKRYDSASGGYLGDFVSAGSGGLGQPNFITFAIPEPSTAALLAVAALLFVRRRRFVHG